MRKRALHHDSSIPRGCGICRPEGLKSTCVCWRSEIPQGRFSLLSSFSLTLFFSSITCTELLFENMPREVQNGIVLVSKAQAWGNDANMCFWLCLSLCRRHSTHFCKQSDRIQSIFLFSAVLVPRASSFSQSTNFRLPFKSAGNFSDSSNNDFSSPLLLQPTGACIFLKVNIQNRDQRYFGKST